MKNLVHKIPTITCKLYSVNHISVVAESYNFPGFPGTSLRPAGLTQSNSRRISKVLEANDRWDNEEVTYQEAKDEFANFIEDAEQFVSTVTEPGPPTTFAGLVKSHEELKALVELIYIDSQELLEGLTSSDTGERRAAALDSFNSNINQFQEKIEEIEAGNTSG